jgi:hypothetical protein
MVPATLPAEALAQANPGRLEAVTLLGRNNITPYPEKLFDNFSSN